MEEVKTNSEVQTAQEDPKLKQYNSKIDDVKAKLKKLNETDNIDAFTTESGAFKTAYVLNANFKDLATKAFEKAQGIRQIEECETEKNCCTYVKVVLDPEKLYTTTPKEWKTEDIIYLRYTNDYSSEDKAKAKITDSGVSGLDGKTPMKIYKTINRELNSSQEFQDVGKLIKEGRKVYKKYLDVIDKKEELEDKLKQLESERAEYIATNKTKQEKNKEEKQKAKEEKKAERAQDKAANNLSALKDELQVKYKEGPQAVKKRNILKFFAQQYAGTPEILEQYTAMGLTGDGAELKKQKAEYEKLSAPGGLADKVIEAADKTYENYKAALENDKKAKPDYSLVEKAWNDYMAVSKPLFEGINAKRKEAAENAKKKIKEERKKGQNAKTEPDKKELADNVQQETKKRMKKGQTRGRGGLDGKQTSPEAAGATIPTANINKTLSKSSDNENSTPANKEVDDNKWTDENIQKIQATKSGLSEEQQKSATTDMGTVLASVATNIIGAVATNPALVSNIDGMISTGEFNADSIQGLGNAMLSNAVGTLTNALMNTNGVVSVEEAMDDAISATATIVTTATNIVPTVKELALATVTTVSDEMTSHITTRVMGILDPSAITTQLTYFMSYYTQLYTASADDLKKKLLSPGDAAISDALEAKNEEAKNAKMTNMTSKITDLKNKAQDAITIAKSGVSMVTTYINNGPDWVIKQLSTYTNFAISQAEKYIDYGADYVEEQRDMYIAMAGEYLGKMVAEKANMIQEQTLKKALDYIEVKKKYATQVAMAAIMTAIQSVVAVVGPMLGKVLKIGVKMGMKQLLKTIGG